MVEENDWRLNGHEKYLMGAELIFFSEYTPRSKDWEHEHCEFCFEKIGIGGVSSGYCTTDRYHFICKDCFGNFKEKFRWKVTENQS